MQYIIPYIEPLSEFWDTYHNDEFFMWSVDKADDNKYVLPELKRFNLN
jgi:hypothetical protein